MYCCDNDITFVKKDGTKLKPYYDWESAMLPKSLFLEYMCNKGLIVNKNGISKDLIVVRFDNSAVVRDQDDIKDGKKGMHHNNLRKKYYQEGITIKYPKKDIHYRMLYRTPGKAKKGECIFIKDTLYSKAIKFLTMNLYEQLPKNNVDIVGLSAYQSLVTGAAIGYIQIPWKHVLVIEDEQVTTNQNCWAVKVIEKKCVVDRSGTNQAKNTLWDGEGLIDESVFPEDMDGFIYCRNHFFKACLFRCNIQQYFKDKFEEKYETATVKDMFGNRIRAKDIKVITTKNAIKWLKFDKYMGDNPYKTYKNWLKKHDNNFAIIKTGHQSKWGDLQRSSYQMMNSLPTTDEEILSKIALPSIEYINKLKTSKEAFIQHLKVTSAPYKINDVLIALDELNECFQYSDFFKENRRKIISNFMYGRVMEGKLLLPGDNLTLCGNPIALLMKTVGENFMHENCFEVKNDAVQCYTQRFAFGEKLAGFRNPHNAPNNFVCFENIDCFKIAKYLPNIGQSVIIVNGIGTDVQPRLNGMDFDSDTVFVTNQEQMVELAGEAYVNYPTVINDIKKNSDTFYDMNMLSYAEMDNKIQGAQISIGKSSNLAQVALSHFYDSGMSDKELEDIFIIGAVLAQCSIDSAKRIFEIEINKEINRLCKSECLPTEGKKMLYPEFFYKITKEKKQAAEDEFEEKIAPQKLNCPMDILPDLIRKGVIDLRKYPKLKLSKQHYSTWFKYISTPREKRQYKTIANIIQTHYNTINSLDNEQKNEKNKEFEVLARKIKTNVLKNDVMHVLIAYALFGNGSRIRNYLLATLYVVNKESFLNCFITTKNEKKVA